MSEAVSPELRYTGTMSTLMRIGATLFLDGGLG
jgi:hypothetical protein